MCHADILPHRKGGTISLLFSCWIVMCPRPFRSEENGHFKGIYDHLNVVVFKKIDFELLL